MMMKLIIDAPPTLKAFLAARSREASSEELNALRAAAEAVQIKAEADKRAFNGNGATSTVVDFARARREREGRLA